MNKHIRAAFFDIDGTLLFGSHEMPDSTVQALHVLQANGVKIFIATGRPPVHLPHLPALQKVNWDGYVAMNGQYCFMADGEVIYSKCIDPAALRTLLPYIEKEKLSIGFVEKDNCYFNLIDERSANFAKELGQGTADIAARIAQNPIYQLSAFLPDNYEEEFLRRCPGCLAVRWSPDFADILPEGGGKPNGLAAMLKHFGWTRDEAIAFGDGGNDVAMLEYAGIGVAMGNACDDAEAAADYVTTDIDKEGIAKALRHFGLV